jgi:hypothetical protein
MPKHRFLIHSLHHNWVIVDIASYTMSQEPAVHMVPSLHFRSWKEAERYFLAQEADAEMIESATAWLKRCGVAVLTIV